LQISTAVVFDMDDTLYPESQYILSGFKACAVWAEQHIGIANEEGYSKLEKLYHDGIRNNTFNVWLEHYNIHDDINIIKQLVQVYRTHKPSITPYPEIPNILSYLSQRRIKIGLVSDGYLTVQQNKFNSLGLAKYFDAIVFSDQWGRENWKPSQRPYVEVLKQLQVEPHNAIYIGDNPTKDFLGANQLGMSTIWLNLNQEYSQLKPPTEEHKANEDCKSLTQLADILDRLCSV